MMKTRKGEIVVTHNNNYLMVAAACWIFALVSIFAQFFSRPISSFEDLAFGIACAVVLFLGGLLALLSRYRWCLRLERDTLSLSPVFGRKRSYVLGDMEFKITGTKFNDLSRRMQRELGMSGPQATIEARRQGKVMFTVSHTDTGFLEFYKRLKCERVTFLEA